MSELFKRWLSKLACHHKWDKIKTVKVYDGDSLRYKLPIYELRLYCCSICGKFKKVKI